MSQLAIERWGVVRISRSERGWFMEENIFAEHNKMSKCMGSPSLLQSDGETGNIRIRQISLGLRIHSRPKGPCKAHRAINTTSTAHKAAYSSVRV
jgi:hypothetical protein